MTRRIRQVRRVVVRKRVDDAELRVLASELKEGRGLTMKLAEAAVLRGTGCGEAATAGRLGISIAAVHGRMRRVYQELDLPDITDLVLLVAQLRNGSGNGSAGTSAGILRKE